MIILLDIGNVIVDVDFSVFCAEVASDPEHESSVREKFCIGSLKADFDRGRLSPKQFFGIVAADPEVKPLAAECFINAWSGIFSLKNGCGNGLQQLKKRYRIWIASDTDPLHFQTLLHEFPLLRGMERYFLSFQHGFLKNSAEAFLFILESSGCRPDELLLIDDKPENCRAASEAGVESICFTGWQDPAVRKLLCR